MWPAGPYALCWFYRRDPPYPGWLPVYIRARIAPLLLDGALELAAHERERCSDRVFWLEAWPEDPPWWRRW